MSFNNSGLPNNWTKIYIKKLNLFLIFVGMQTKKFFWQFFYALGHKRYCWLRFLFFGITEMLLSFFVFLCIPCLLFCFVFVCCCLVLLLQHLPLPLSTSTNFLRHDFESTHNQQLLLGLVRWLNFGLKKKSYRESLWNFLSKKKRLCWKAGRQ